MTPLQLFIYRLLRDYHHREAFYCKNSGQFQFMQFHSIIFAESFPAVCNGYRYIPKDFFSVDETVLSLCSTRKYVCVPECTCNTGMAN